MRRSHTSPQGLRTALPTSANSSTFWVRCVSVGVGVFPTRAHRRRTRPPSAHRHRRYRARSEAYNLALERQFIGRIPKGWAKEQGIKQQKLLRSRKPPVPITTKAPAPTAQEEGGKAAVIAASLCTTQPHSCGAGLRIDMTDGHAYSLLSFIEVYGGSRADPPPEWTTAKTAKPAPINQGGAAARASKPQATAPHVRASTMGTGHHSTSHGMGAANTGSAGAQPRNTRKSRSRVQGSWAT